jgi:hypothetical protein
MVGLQGSSKMFSVGIDLVRSSCPFLVGCLLVVGAFSYFPASISLPFCGF